MKKYEPITQAELESSLWGAANSLRGAMDAADYKNYVFPVLFWKWISDNHEYETEQFEEEYRDVELSSVEAAIVESEFHAFEIPEGCSWKNVYLNEDLPDHLMLADAADSPMHVRNYLGTRIRMAMNKIAAANTASLANIFGDATFGNKDRLPEDALRGMLKHFSDITLNTATVPGDLMGNAYEYLLKQFADDSGSKAGEFFTPRPVVRMITRILAPQAEESVYDPTCGSGGMLIESVNVVRENGGDPRTLRIYGQEKNFTTQAIARMNLYIHGLPEHTIYHGNTLLEPTNRNDDGSFETYDVVIANPPFSVSDWGVDIWATDNRVIGDVAPQNKADWAFVQHMLASMDKEHGRIGVVMPHGVLFRPGAEKRIREAVLKLDQLEAVIGLPPKLFYGTGIPSCVLVFRAKKDEERKGKVMFIDASAKFIKDGNMNTLRDKDIETILKAYHEDQDIDGEGEGLEFSYATLREIEDNGWDLSIGRYVSSSVASELDVDSAIEKLTEARIAAEAAREEFAKRMAKVGFDV